jgi:hypothetical protein
MGVEQGEALKEQIQDKMSAGFRSGLTVVCGEGCGRLMERSSFEFIVLELVNNCAEKDATDIQVDVGVRYDAAKDEFELTVSDNVRYEPPKLAEILHSLGEAEVVRIDKSSQRDAGGGMGIATCRTFLSKWEGTLIYEATEEGTIKAVARWKKDAFDKTRSAA